jgi:5-methylcytosine-specific restriction endonuclease McrA
MNETNEETPPRTPYHDRPPLCTPKCITMHPRPRKDRRVLLTALVNPAWSPDFLSPHPPSVAGVVHDYAELAAYGRDRSGLVTVPERGRAYRRRRLALIRRSPWCVHCGQKVSLDVPMGAPNRGTIDHLWPEVRGGKIAAENEAVSCSACNSKKGARAPSGPDPHRSRDW